MMFGRLALAGEDDRALVNNPVAICLLAADAVAFDAGPVADPIEQENRRCVPHRTGLFGLRIVIHSDDFPGLCFPFRSDAWPILADNTGGSTPFLSGVFAPHISLGSNRQRRIYGISVVDHACSFGTSCRGCNCRWLGEGIYAGDVPARFSGAWTHSICIDHSVRCRRMDSERRAAALRSRNGLPDDRIAADSQLLHFRFRSLRSVAISQQVIVAVATDASGARLICAAFVVDLRIYQLDYLGLR